MAVRFSRCCNPVPGDEIIGFVTRGRGVTIHRTDCVNVLNFPESERERLIDAKWKRQIPEVKNTVLRLIFTHRTETGLIVDISRVFTEANIDLRFIKQPC